MWVAFRVLVCGAIGLGLGLLLRQTPLRGGWIAVAGFGAFVGCLLALPGTSLRRTARLLIVMILSRLYLASDEAFEWVEVPSRRELVRNGAVSTSQPKPRLFAGGRAVLAVAVFIVTTFLTFAARDPSLFRGPDSLDEKQLEERIQKAVEAGTAGEAFRRLVSDDHDDQDPQPEAVD